jgi:hypothetical protein
VPLLSCGFVPISVLESTGNATTSPLPILVLESPPALHKLVQAAKGFSPLFANALLYDLGVWQLGMYWLSPLLTISLGQGIQDPAMLVASRLQMTALFQRRDRGI